MKNKELKTLWKLAISWWIIFTIFWLIETIIFLLIEGWHIKPTNKIEIFCDKLVSFGWTFALQLTIIICVYYILNLNKNK